MPDLNEWPVFAPPPVDEVETPYHSPDDMWIHHIPKLQRLQAMETTEKRTGAVFEFSFTLSEDPSLDQEFRTPRSPPPPSVISITTTSTRWSVQEDDADDESVTFTALRPKPSQDYVNFYQAEVLSPSLGAFTFFDSEEDEDAEPVDEKTNIDGLEDVYEEEDEHKSEITYTPPLSDTFSVYGKDDYNSIGRSTPASPLSDHQRTVSSSSSDSGNGQLEKAARILGLNRTSLASSNSSRSPQPFEKRHPRSFADRVASSTKGAYRELIVRIVDSSKRHSEEA